MSHRDVGAWLGSHYEESCRCGGVESELEISDPLGSATR